MKLDDLREQIDKTDAEIVRLIGQRMKIAEGIGKEKGKQHRHIVDKEREHSVLENVRHIAREEKVNQEDVESIYKQIVAISKGTQEMVVAFQGEIGAYGEEAAFQFFEERPPAIWVS